MAQSSADMPIRIRSQASSVRGANRTYSHDIQIGRDETCDVQAESAVVSRVHAEIIFEEGRWWVVDNGSTNGTYLDGEPIDRGPLPVEAELQLGKDGPVFQLQRSAAEQSGMPTSERTGSSLSPAAGPTHPEAASSADARDGEGSGSTSEQMPSRPDASVTQYVQRYFEGSEESNEESAGQHTRLLRQAYQRAQSQERRRYRWMIAGALSLCVLLGGFAVWQSYYFHFREAVQRKAAEQRKLDAQIARLDARDGKTPEADSIRKLREKRQDLEEEYNSSVRKLRSVRQLGFRRDLTPKEKTIYKVARIFGESEAGIPAGFVRKVKQKIEEYWKEAPHRSRLISAIQRAEKQGYTELIVRMMREHRLPPEFFYLALQESDFDSTEVGPSTDWGIAKGMWQFIPSTARDYGLDLGPRWRQRVFDRQDERHDFEKSTRAAARYLQDIYGTKAQASGLLVIASYNWGEHRVTRKLEDMKELKDIPKDPEKRNYWQLLKNYSDRIPDQTKDYVLKVFSAAVIGRDPDRFGFHEINNPLREHMDGLSASEAQAAELGGNARGVSSPLASVRPENQ